MVGTSKILTVSYGTFSCTLEGFDDPFTTMRMIAEYFRDLSAQDRYFGSEPATPDPAMLARIAQQDSGQRVIAKVGDKGLSLQAAEAAALPGTAGPADAAAQALPVVPGKQASAAPGHADAPASQASAPQEQGKTRRMNRKDRSAAKARALAATAPGVAAPVPDPVPTPGVPAAAEADVATKMARIRAVTARPSEEGAGLDNPAGNDSPFEEQTAATLAAFAPAGAIEDAFLDAAPQFDDLALEDQPAADQPEAAGAPATQAASDLTEAAALAAAELPSEAAEPHEALAGIDAPGTDDPARPEAEAEVTADKDGVSAAAMAVNSHLAGDTHSDADTAATAVAEQDDGFGPAPEDRPGADQADAVLAAPGQADTGQADSAQENDFASQAADAALDAVMAAVAEAAPGSAEASPADSAWAEAGPSDAGSEDRPEPHLTVDNGAAAPQADAQEESGPLVLADIAADAEDSVDGDGLALPELPEALLDAIEEQALAPSESYTETDLASDLSGTEDSDTAVDAAAPQDAPLDNIAGTPVSANDGEISAGDASALQIAAAPFAAFPEAEPVADESLDAGPDGDAGDEAADDLVAATAPDEDGTEPAVTADPFEEAAEVSADPQDNATTSAAPGEPEDDYPALAGASADGDSAMPGSEGGSEAAFPSSAATDQDAGAADAAVLAEAGKPRGDLAEDPLSVDQLASARVIVSETEVRSIEAHILPPLRSIPNPTGPVRLVRARVVKMRRTEQSVEQPLLARDPAGLGPTAPEATAPGTTAPATTAFEPAASEAVTEAPVPQEPIQVQEPVPAADEDSFAALLDPALFDGDDKDDGFDAALEEALAAEDDALSSIFDTDFPEESGTADDSLDEDLPIAWLDEDEDEDARAAEADPPSPQEHLSGSAEAAQEAAEIPELDELELSANLEADEADWSAEDGFADPVDGDLALEPAQDSDSPPEEASDPLDENAIADDLARTLAAIRAETAPRPAASGDRATGFHVEIDPPAATSNPAFSRVAAEVPDAEIVDHGIDPFDGSGATHDLRRTRLARREGASDLSVTRILRETNSQLDDSEASRRRSTIAHLKAAVAATRADREDGVQPGEDEEDLGRYREDLQRAVRPRRPESTIIPRRLAPLMLATEQRVDVAEPEPGDQQVRPRRITAGNLAVQDEEEEAEGADISDATPFADFASRSGARDISDLLEAAAAYAAFVEGRPHVSRPQLMHWAMSADPRGTNREDSLRAFGTLLRSGKIQRLKRGQFTISDGSRFQPD